MSELEQQVHNADHTDRLLLDQISDKWSLLVLAELCDAPLRFNELKRRMEGVTPKALTECLKRLERNGIITRHVIDASPVAVEYRITPLGRTLEEPFAMVRAWAADHQYDVERARQEFDRRTRD